MSSPPGEWSSLKVTGQAPPPCSLFTLTTVGEKRAAMYGGWDGSYTFDHLFIVELGTHSVVNVITCIHKIYIIPKTSSHKIMGHLAEFVPNLFS